MDEWMADRLSQLCGLMNGLTGQLRMVMVAVMMVLSALLFLSRACLLPSL